MQNSQDSSSGGSYSTSDPATAGGIDSAASALHKKADKVRLAKTEIGEESAKACAAGVLIALGAVGGLFSVMFVLLAAVYALSLIVPAWVAAVCVAVALPFSPLPSAKRVRERPARASAAGGLLR